MRVISKSKSAARRMAGVVRDIRERRLKSPLYTSLHSNFDTALHLREATQWLIRAQDHGDDRGVSYGANFGQGFLDSYPETTGYIICTFLELARYYGDDEYRRRAIEMGEWESAIQLSSGAVRGSICKENPTPAVFNTGMVLLDGGLVSRDGIGSISRLG